VNIPEYTKIGRIILSLVDILTDKKVKNILLEMELKIRKGKKEQVAVYLNCIIDKVYTNLHIY
jgi:hypothetical protein